MLNKSQKNNQDYASNFTTALPPKEVLTKISDVSKWWSKKVEGSSKPGNIFIASFKNGDWYKIKVENDVSNNIITWNVVDAEQTWHDNRKEWVNTKIIWEISPVKNGSYITMTHLGLVPEFECFDKCSAGWDYLLYESLRNYLTDGVGLPV